MADTGDGITVGVMIVVETPAAMVAVANKYKVKQGELLCPQNQTNKQGSWLHAHTAQIIQAAHQKKWPKSGQRLTKKQVGLRKR